MKLQAVTVSVNYSDFLVHTLEENKNIFDKWIIITDTTDHKTVTLCKEYEQYNVVCIQTDVFYTKGIFNKFAAINEGLKLIDKDAWVLFLDSDIVLPTETYRVLDNLNLDKTVIYGLDRLNCTGLKQWNEYKTGNTTLIENWILKTNGLEMGSRLVHYYGQEGENGRFEGWRPLGFFQLAHREAFESYPQNSLGADHCDLEFARLWPRNKRILIPELYVIHLESIRATDGANWNGRTTEPFTIIDEVPNILIYECGVSTHQHRCSVKCVIIYFTVLYYKFIKLFRKTPLKY